MGWYCWFGLQISMCWEIIQRHIYGNMFLIKLGKLIFWWRCILYYSLGLNEKSPAVVKTNSDSSLAHEAALFQSCLSKPCDFAPRVLFDPDPALFIDVALRYINIALPSGWGKWASIRNQCRCRLRTSTLLWVNWPSSPAGFLGRKCISSTTQEVSAMLCKPIALLWKF